MVEVAAALARRGAALLAQHAIHRDQVDQLGAGAQLHQADGVRTALNGQAQHLDVEPLHRRGVLHPQHQVVEAPDLQRHASARFM